MDIFKIKKGDSLPVFAVTLQYNNGSAIDLTNGSVFLHLGNLSDYSPYFSGACVITSASGGTAEYRWTGSPDTFITGTYWSEFQASWTGSNLTLPSDHSLQVKIFEDYE